MEASLPPKKRRRRTRGKRRAELAKELRRQVKMPQFENETAGFHAPAILERL
jgi:hypothetical protein